MQCSEGPGGTINTALSDGGVHQTDTIPDNDISAQIQNTGTSTRGEGETERLLQAEEPLNQGINSGCRAQKNSRKCIKVVSLLVPGILCVAIAASLAMGLTIALRVHPDGVTQTTNIVTTDNNIGSQFVWLANLSTRWYTSFDVRLLSSNASLVPMPVYAVPMKKLAPQSLMSNLTCTCSHENLQLPCELPNYNVTPVKEFLYAGFQFIYNICASSSVSNAITLQAYIFEITNDLDYDAFKHYLSTGNASSALVASDPVQMKGILKQACVHLHTIIPRNAFYFAVTSVRRAPETLPILYLKECNVVVQYRDFSRTEYSQSCSVSDDRPCTSASLLPGLKNFIVNTLDPQTLAILVNASQLYPVPTMLQVTATATNSNVFLFISIAALLLILVYVITICVCVTVVAKYCRKNSTSQ